MCGPAPALAALPTRLSESAAHAALHRVQTREVTGIYPDQAGVRGPYYVDNDDCVRKSSRRIDCHYDLFGYATRDGERLACLRRVNITLKHRHRRPSTQRIVLRCTGLEPQAG